MNELFVSAGGRSALTETPGRRFLLFTREGFRGYGTVRGAGGGDDMGFLEVMEPDEQLL